MDNNTGSGPRQGQEGRQTMVWTDASEMGRWGVECNSNGMLGRRTGLLRDDDDRVVVFPTKAEAAARAAQYQATANTSTGTRYSYIAVRLTGSVR